MKGSDFWIKNLGLSAHPEGGFYKETYRSHGTIDLNSSESTPINRNISTAIYFLLRSADRSAFHRIKSDELWHFHEGSGLIIYTLSPEKGLEENHLGINIEKGEQPQIIIPSNTWFGALVKEEGAYCLASCTVAPGFDFSDFEMADRAKLLQEFSPYREMIIRLT